MLDRGQQLRGVPLWMIGPPEKVLKKCKNKDNNFWNIVGLILRNFSLQKLSYAIVPRLARMLAQYFIKSQQLRGCSFNKIMNMLIPALMLYISIFYAPLIQFLNTVCSQNFIHKLKMHPMHQDQNIYEINLFQNIDFYSIDKDFNSLYDNFHPVYYLYDYWGTKVTSFSLGSNKIPELYFQFVAKDSELSQELKFIAYELKRDDSSKKDSHEIEYSFENEKDGKKSGSLQKSRIKVIFQKRTEIQRIDIRIIDESAWFKKNYQKLEKITKNQVQNLERVSIERRIGKRQIEYFYKEPENQRHRIFSRKDGEHYSLALQGGGVKGISYIGVNQALKSEHGDDIMKKVVSIIGSSAGGILGLAFCCSMDKEELLDVVATLGRIPSIDKIKLDENLKKKGEMYIKQLTETLVEFGIVQPALLSFIGEIFQNPAISGALIDLLKTYNSELAHLFLDDEENLSFARLLSGELMYGNEISKIAYKCLAKVFGEKSDEFLKTITFKELYKKTNIQFTCTSVDLEDQIIRFFNHKTTPNMPVSIAVQMTGSFPVAFRRQIWRKQWGMYYIHHHSTRREKDLVGHEFTDGGMLSNFPIKYLDNDHMRPMYFSHKTTETKIYGFGLLEVKDEQYVLEKNVQIKNKFEQLVQIFKNENFVMKLICGVISSSCKNWFCCPKTTTKLSYKRYKDERSHDEEELEQLNSSSAILKQRDNEDDQDGKDLLHELSRIPLIKFGLALLKTFFKSDVNFEKECFAQQCYNTAFNELKEYDGLNHPKQTWFSPYVHEEYVKKITEIINETVSLLNTDQKDLELKVMTNIQQNLRYLAEKLKREKNQIKEQSLVGIASNLISSITVVYSEFRKKEVGRQLMSEIKTMISILNKIITPTFFYRQNLVKDSEQLEEIIQKFNQIHKAIFAHEIEIRSIIEREVATKQSIVKSILHYAEYLNAQPLTRKKFAPIHYSSCLNWIAIEKYHFVVDYKKLKALKTKSLAMSVPQLAIANYAWKKRRYLRSYVHRILSRNLHFSESKKGYNVHVILESKQLSELYFNEYLIYLQQAIEDFNQINNINQCQQRYRIRAITASGYQSLAAILYASRLPRQKMNAHIWNIKNTIEAAPHIPKKFSKMQWTQTNQKLIMEIEEHVWKQKSNFFKDTQKKTEQSLSSGNDSFNFNREILDLSNSRQEINLAFERIVDYAVEALTIMENEEESLEKRRKKIAQLMAISYQKENNAKVVEKTNKDSKKFYEFMLDRFEDLIKYSILVVPHVNENLLERIHDPEIRKQAWKGTLLAQTLSNIKFKALIKEALIDMGLIPQCTLKQLFNSVKKEDRITVNLLAIQTITSKITIINHQTRPQMPVWAAIMATSSIPYMHKPTPDARAWRSSNEWQNRRLIAKYFGPEKGKNIEYLESGNNLSKIPLQLITNRKVRNLIKACENQSYIAFTFDDLPNSINSNGKEVSNFEKVLSTSMKQMTIKPLDRYTLGKLFFFDKLDQMLKITAVTQRFQQLNIYVNSHDNTFLNAYRKQSIQLPIKVSTLDFNRINMPDRENPQNSQLTPVVLECIEDAKNVTKEKINNTDKILLDGHRKLYIKIRKIETISESNQDRKQVLSLEFVSAVTQDFFDMTQRYRIFYQFDRNKPVPLRQMDDVTLYLRENKLKEVKKDKIIILDTEKDSRKTEQHKQKINLKIIFPQKIARDRNPPSSEQYQVSTVYHQLDLSEFIKKQGQFRFVYEFHYDTFYGTALNQKIEPIPEQKINKGGLSIPIQSFNVELWTNSQICDNCGDNFGKISTDMIKSQKCCLCGKKAKIVYICQNKRCTTTFCVNCKFMLKFEKIGMYCCLGHCLGQEAGTDENSDQFYQKKICNLCSAYRPIVYYDKECHVRICDFCVNRQKLRK